MRKMKLNEKEALMDMSRTLRNVGLCLDLRAHHPQKANDEASKMVTAMYEKYNLVEISRGNWDKDNGEGS